MLLFPFVFDYYAKKQNKLLFFLKIFQKDLTKGWVIDYNVECHCVKAYSTAESETLPI